MCTLRAGCPADLCVVLTAGVVGGLVEDRLVGAGCAELVRGRERRRVGLKLQVALVLEPVRDVDDEAREQDQHGQPDRDR